MTFRHLEIFLSVCKTGNMTRSAQQLYMTQPAITRAIKELEAEYGVILFERITHKLTLTKEGERMYERCVHIKEQFEQMEREIADPEGRQIVRIGASITLGNFLMPELIKELKTLYPKAEFYVRVGRGQTIVRMLKDNEVDIGFVENDVKDDSLVVKRISENRMVLISSPDNPLAFMKEVKLTDVMSYPLLHRQAGSVGREFVDSVLIANGYQPKPVWESASTQALVRAVANGLGVAILPEKLVHNASKRGEIVTKEIVDVSFLRHDNVLYHKNKYLSPLLKNIIAESVELAAKTKC